VRLDALRVPGKSASSTPKVRLVFEPTQGSVFSKQRSKHGLADWEECFVEKHSIRRGFEQIDCIEWFFELGDAVLASGKGLNSIGVSDLSPTGRNI